MTFRSGGEARVIVRGLGVLFLVAVLFGAGKVAFWRSEVVHEEPTSIHRSFPGGIVLRFPQEAVNAADVLTGAFLVLGGGIALAVSFGMGERLRRGRVTRARDARSVRAFFALAGIGLVWLGIDEVFLVHELVSANLYVGDAWILLGYAGIGGCAVLAWQRVLRSSGPALGVMAAGAVLHGAALVLDFAQESIGWAPEEPLEMLAAALYAIAMATYATRLVLEDALSAPPAANPVVRELPDSAIQPLSDPAWSLPCTD